VYPAFFALYPTYEKVHGVRSLQYSNGVRPLPLWCAHVLFDFLFILLSAIICTVVIAVEAPAWFQVGVMFPIFVLYGMAAALFAYVISTFAKSQLGAFGTAAGIQSVMFILSALTFSVRR
jgi:ATP-binding cassette subfamily A (ABC1) protein 3